jgi:hypothetical protein
MKKSLTAADAAKMIIQEFKTPADFLYFILDKMGAIYSYDVNNRKGSLYGSYSLLENFIKEVFVRWNLDVNPKRAIEGIKEGLLSIVEKFDPGDSYEAKIFGILKATAFDMSHYSNDSDETRPTINKVSTLFSLAPLFKGGSE